MIYYCPVCWAELGEAQPVCPHCGADLGGVEHSYQDKLIAALRHPEPLTQRRAAYLLGLLADPSAVPALTAVLEESADPYLRAEAAIALGRIGGPDARAALARVLANGRESVIVRHAASQALGCEEVGMERRDG